MDYNITTAEQAVGLLNAALQAGRTSILIVAPDVGGAALPAAGRQPPSRGQAQDRRAGHDHHASGRGAHLGRRDLALLSGATILGTPSGRTPKAPRPPTWGLRCAPEFNSEKLAVIAEPQHRAEVQEVIAELRSYLDSLGLDGGGRPAAERAVLPHSAAAWACSRSVTFPS
ncbi:MAG: hypothetical protein U0X20_03245 [Caldilineaceae bacterium]